MVWKTNKKEDEACGKGNENKDKQRSGENNNERYFENSFLKQDKRKRMATNY